MENNSVDNKAKLNINFENLDLILGHISDCIYILNTKKQMIYTNFNKSEKLKCSSDVCESLKIQIDQALKTGQVVSGETSYLCPTDMLRHYVYSIEPLADKEGNVQYLICVLHEITEYKQAREALQISNKRLQEIIDGSNNFIFVRDKAGKFLITSRHAEESVGKPREWFPGKTMYDFLSKEKADYFTALDKKVLETGEPTIVEEEETLQADGKGHIFLANRFPLFDINGQAYAVAGISTDITEIKRMEQALENSEEKYRRFFELGLVGMAIESLNGDWIEVNERLCEILGYTHDELITKNWKDLTHPDDLAKDMEQFQNLQEGKTDHYSLEKRYIRKDGKIINCLLSVGRSKIGKDAISDIYVIVDDITAEKQYEMALVKAKEDLMMAIREVLSGNQYIKQVMSSFDEIDTRHVAQNHEDPLDKLSPKQREILRMVAKGNTSEEIAAKLFLSKRTVDFHRSVIRKKLGLNTHQELLRYCIEARLL